MYAFNSKSISLCKLLSETPQTPAKDLDYRGLYEMIKTHPTVSFLSVITNSRGAPSNGGFPIFSSQDLNYLSSLSQEEFEEVREAFIKKIEYAGIEYTDSIQNSYYIKVFDILGGHEGMDRLINFAQEYLALPSGWDQIEPLIPESLSLEQGNIYISMANYIDKIARPIYETLISKTIPNTRGDNPVCDWYLTQRLAIAGVAISTEEFIDCMTGGAATPLEIVATGADLLGIWLDYEVCNHRWH